MAKPKLYECHNPACSLGQVGRRGRFTGGITAVQLNLLTGRPVQDMVKGEDYGEGFCTNCGEQAVEYDAAANQEEQLAEAKAAYDAQVAAIKGGVA